MLHKTIVVGHVGKFEFLHAEEPFVKMRIAVDDRGKTLWYTAVGFGHVYMNAKKTVKTGTIVVLEGRMHERASMINGQKRFFNDLVIDQLRCLGSPGTRYEDVDECEESEEFVDCPTFEPIIQGNVIRFGY